LGTREAIRESPFFISERVKAKIKGGTVTAATPERVGLGEASVAERPRDFD